MQLRDLGEFGLIDRIERAVRRLGAAPGVVIGIGDDAAVLRPKPREDVAVTTDALVEGVHFRWRSEGARNVGRRALVASLSDLAAMGARPLGFTLALATPPSLQLRSLDEMLAGLLREAREHGCPLIGGNLSGAGETSLTVTALGAVSRGRSLTRAGARSGDRIFVTGTLGGAALAVARAERGLGRIRRVPTPRLGAGRALARIAEVGACIDISDGLEADLRHILRPGGLEAEIDPARVPRPARFSASCARLGLNADRLALAGGEDYELLFTVRAAGPSSARLERRLGVPVAEIGRAVRAGGPPGRGEPGGWRHF